MSSLCTRLAQHNFHKFHLREVMFVRSNSTVAMLSSLMISKVTVKCCKSNADTSNIKALSKSENSYELRILSVCNTASLDFGHSQMESTICLKTGQNNLV